MQVLALRLGLGIQLSLEIHHGGAQFGVGDAEHAHREETGVPRATDGNRRDWNASGHLHDGKQGIQSLQMLGGHRHTQHRHGSLGRQHARQMGRTTGAGDNGGKTPLARIVSTAERTATAD